jgi:hypothetical protein
MCQPAILQHITQPPAPLGQLMGCCTCTWKTLVRADGGVGQEAAPLKGQVPRAEVKLFTLPCYPALQIVTLRDSSETALSVPC